MYGWWPMETLEKTTQGGGEKKRRERKRGEKERTRSDLILIDIEASSTPYARSPAAVPSGEKEWGEKRKKGEGEDVLAPRFFLINPHPADMASAGETKPKKKET